MNWDYHAETTVKDDVSLVIVSGKQDKFCEIEKLCFCREKHGSSFIEVLKRW